MAPDPLNQSLEQPLGPLPPCDAITNVVLGQYNRPYLRRRYRRRSQSAPPPEIESLVPIYWELPFYSRFLEQGRLVRIRTHPDMGWRRYETIQAGDPELEAPWLDQMD